MLNRDNLKDICPLTPMQAGMLYQAQLDTGSSAYHEQITFTLVGGLNLTLYHKAWGLLVERHDVLRSVFIADKTQQPLQAVLRSAPDFFTAVDVSGQPDEDQQQTIERYLQDDLAHRFDLAGQPPLRVKLFNLGTQRWCLVWSFHHILLDGWSVGILMGEMTQIYVALQQNKPPQLPPVPPFSRYLHWLGQQDPQAGLRFWQTYLDGYTGTAALPACGGQEQQAKELKISLPDTLPERLQACAQAHKVTVNVLLQAAWGLLLGRYTNRQDVVFATVVSGRPSQVADIERIVGLLINAVPVRVRFTMEETVAVLLARLHQHNTDSQAYQFLALADVQPPEGAPDHLLVFENYHLDTAVLDTNQNRAEEPVLSGVEGPVLSGAEGSGVEGPVLSGAEGIRVSSVHAREETAYGLTMVIAPGTTWTLTCLYDQARFGASYIRQVAGHFINLMDALARQTDAPIAALDMLSAAETAQLLDQGRGAANAFPEQASLATLFADAVRRHGPRTALVSTDSHYSFLQLNTEANRFAHGLMAAGVQPGDIVAVALPRSALRVIAVLGLIKAGAAYLGIEADTPASRVAWLCRDAGVRLIIQQGGSDGTVPCFDPGRTLSEAYSDADPNTAVSAAAIAYISYTSGSTGEPKGVCVSQRNVARLAINTDFIDISSDDVFLQFAPLSFDASTFELWLPLLNGACVAVIDNAQPGLAELGAAIKQHRASVLWLTAGLFHQMVDAQLDDLGGVRHLLAGGDVVSPAHVVRLLDRHPGMTFSNGYGPTENTTFSCCHRITATSGLASLRSGQAVPIGQPIAHSEAWVLDQQLRPQPLAAIGELYVGGAGVALGYWRRAGLTASAFVPHPYAPGGRLYRTGDLACLNGQSLLEFIGRADRQFKIRGFRVEAQEVESMLKQLPEINDALVDVALDATGDKRLVAYVIVSEKATPGFAVQDLGDTLATVLPQHLIPDAFVGMAAFPLNQNGKVDRRLLPDPFASGPVGSCTAAADDTERALLAIWQQVLNKNNMGVTDDFFRWGGHSLKATQVISLIRKQMGKEVPLRLLFEAPTIRAFAEKMRALEQTESTGPQLIKRDRSQRKVV